jgi:hypothetical protein
MSERQAEDWVKRADGYWTRGAAGRAGSMSIVRVGGRYHRIVNQPPRATIASYSSLEAAMAADTAVEPAPVCHSEARPPP